MIFPSSIKTKPTTLTPSNVVRKQYIQSTKAFEFGTVLAGKAKDPYMEFKHPENYEKFHVSSKASRDLPKIYKWKSSIIEISSDKINSGEDEEEEEKN